jgi:hypothetical protein
VCAKRRKGRKGRECNGRKENNDKQEHVSCVQASIKRGQIRKGTSHIHTTGRY